MIDMINEEDKPQSLSYHNQITEISIFHANKDQDLEDYGYGGI